MLVERVNKTKEATSTAAYPRDKHGGDREATSFSVSIPFGWKTVNKNFVFLLILQKNYVVLFISIQKFAYAFCF